MFPEDEAAEKWLVKQRWPDGVGCPKCGSLNIQERKTRKPQPYRCRDCRRDFSVKTDSLMHSSPLGCQTWVFAIYLVTTSLKGVSSMKLHRDLKISQKSTWHLLHRIRENFHDQNIPFSGPVEADETYMGGKRKNMSKAKRKQIKGSGSVGKTAVVGVKNRPSNEVRGKFISNTFAASSSPIPSRQVHLQYLRGKFISNTKGATLRSFVLDNTKPGTKIYTDEALAYKRLPNQEAVRHASFEYVRGQVHTNGVESFWSMLKRAHTGTFHKMSPKHLQRYVNEFAGRHDLRELDTMEQMESIVRQMDLKRLPYKELVK